MLCSQTSFSTSVAMRWISRAGESEISLDGDWGKVFGIGVPAHRFLVMIFGVLLSQSRGSADAWDFWDFCAHGDAGCRELLVLVQPQLWNAWASLGLMWEGLDHALALLQNSSCNDFVPSLWCTGNPIQKSVLS